MKNFRRCQRLLPVKFEEEEFINSAENKGELKVKIESVGEGSNCLHQTSKDKYQADNATHCPK